VGITTGAGRHDVSSNWAFVRANESADITLIALASRTSRPSPVVKDRAPGWQRLARIRSRSWAASGPEQVGHSRGRNIARLLPVACVRLQGRRIRRSAQCTCRQVASARGGEDGFRSIPNAELAKDAFDVKLDRSLEYLELAGNFLV